MAVQFETVCVPKFMTFWDHVGDPLLSSTHLTDCLHRVSFRRHRPLKLPLSCEVGSKRWFSAPIVGMNTPDFGHAFSKSSYVRACSRFWSSYVQQTGRLGGEKEERRIPVKYNSADRYVGRPNMAKQWKIIQIV